MQTSVSHRTVGRLVALSVGASLSFAASMGNAQSFLYDHDLPYTPDNCSAEPAYDRTFRLQRITWKGHEYLFVDEGNDLRLFNIDNPLNPHGGSLSHFHIPYYGDVDYNLWNFSVCDDCRWGVLNHRGGLMLFDLGTGATPSFGADSSISNLDLVHGAFTFSHAGQQYLVAASIGASPCPNNKSGLYQLNGLDQALNPLLHCLDNGGSGPAIVNGLVVADSPTPTLYMSDGGGLFHIYSMQTVPSFRLQYEGNGGIERARMLRGYGAAVDDAAGLAAVSWNGVASLYDIGWATGSPTHPALLHSQALPSLPNSSAVGLRFPILWTAQVFSPDPPLTFDVSAPTAPVPLDQTFWDPSRPWNSFSTCLWNNQVTFSVDGSVMYLSRYAALQVIDVSSIQPPASLCGDGVVGPLEGCDDGNTAAGDGCSAACQPESGWTCSGEPSSCVPPPAGCGDGQLESPEGCDDGNTTDGDGCSAACQPESGWTCSGEPSICTEPTTPCGDGHVDPGEECDDGNLTTADGCSQQCLLEPGWSCAGQPSVCSEQASPPAVTSDPASAADDGGCGCTQRKTPPCNGTAVGLVALLLCGARRRRNA